MLRLTAAALLAKVAVGDVESHPTVAALWERFKQDFGRTYADEKARFEIFRANLEFIRETNAKGLTFELGVNQFADMTPLEFAEQHTGLLRPASLWGNAPHLGTFEYSGQELAQEVDWTTKGAVAPVKNQGQCGSCWSFSTTGALEGAWAIATGQLTPLSEQQFVDCDKEDSGCNGGLMDTAFQFAENNAICTEQSYGYKGSRGSCRESSCTVGIPEGGVVGFKDVRTDDMKSLMEALMQQPVSIAIEADRSVFQLYKSGILRGACGSTLDHGVLAVGYGSDAGVKYWKVKNSWGTSWGEEGYVRLLRGAGGAGECGLLSGPPSFPEVTGKPGPAPGPSPPTPPTPPSPSFHYEEPPCQQDEVQASVEGAGGVVCAPVCDSGSCPSDVPPGTRAKPQCILQDASSGEQYCALSCMLPFMCPKGAKCARLQGLSGICVYPPAEALPAKTLALAGAGQEATINV